MENSNYRGGILVDDLGLSKTIQALALIKSHLLLLLARRVMLVVILATLIQ
jgi:SNF2 family DNA or RNA helicase